jgi:hypothetical protein
MAPGLEFATTESFDGWHIRSYGDRNIIICSRCGCWCITAGTTVLVDGVTVQTTVTTHPTMDQAAAVCATMDMDNASPRQW